MGGEEAERDLLARLIAAAGEPSPDGLALRLLAYFGSLHSTLSASPSALARASGGDPLAARLLPAVRSVWMHCLRGEVTAPSVFSHLAPVIGYLRARLAAAPQEKCRILFLDAKNGLIADHSVGAGATSEITVYPGEVILHALDLGAAGLILVHNHSSGDPEPSAADIEVTRQIVLAARPFGLTVHDHIIVARGGWTSLRARGLL